MISDIIQLQERYLARAAAKSIANPCVPPQGPFEFRVPISIYIPSQPELDAFKLGYEAGGFAERERCAKIPATPESTAGELIGIGAHGPSSWAAGYMAACVKIEQRIRAGE